MAEQSSANAPNPDEAKGTNADTLGRWQAFILMVLKLAAGTILILTHHADAGVPLLTLGAYSLGKNGFGGRDAGK